MLNTTHESTPLKSDTKTRCQRWGGCLAMVLAFTLCASVQAGDVSGDQTGTWALADSPFNLVGDVTVPAGEALLIEAGVTVIGMGNYTITVDVDATLTAVGSVSAPIIFTAQDQGAGWRGLRLESASDDTLLSYCIFEYARGTGSYPAVRGGAVMVRNCSPTISHSTFRYNYSANGNRNGCGGGVATEFSSALIEFNLFHDNESDSGGAIATLEYGSPRISGNVILANRAFNGGGGLYLGARSSPLIENNHIAGNHSAGWGGGGINSWTAYSFYQTFATIRNNLIVYNTASSAGGGLYLRYDRTILTNNTIAFNSAAIGDGIYVLNQGFAVPAIENCLIFDNGGGGDEIYLLQSTGSQVTVTYSDVEGGWSGVGNIAEDPQFADPDGADNIAGNADDDFRLTAGSGAIDSGNNYAVAGDVTTDLAGLPRFMDDAGVVDRGQGNAPIVDMGSYEFQGTSLGLSGPVPGIAGRQNELSVIGATPNEFVFFGYGLRDGSTAVPSCAGLTVKIAQAKLIGKARADGAGAASLRFRVPGNAAGFLVLLQSVDLSDCRVSNRVDHQF